MRLLNQPEDAGAPGGKVCLAIGMFDGVHLGHQQVIGRTIDDARQHEALAVVATFDRHPNCVVAPERAPKLLFPLAKKLRLIEGLGADAIWLIRFDPEFSRVSAEDFVRGFIRGFGRVQSLCVGGDFTFGHRRGGDVALLRRLGAELGFTVHGLSSVALDGAPVRSTRIRECVVRGDFDDAGQMLGRAYTLCGIVTVGDRLGRTLGFPTANIDIEGLTVPPTGVYAVHVSLDGAMHRGVFNLGYRPTLARPERVLRAEAHLFDYNGDLYGREIEVAFVGRVRDERSFASLEELRAQIERDTAAARRMFDDPAA